MPCDSAVMIICICFLCQFSTIEVDTFTAKIFDIYEKTRKEGLSQVTCYFCSTTIIMIALLLTTSHFIS